MEIRENREENKYGFYIRDCIGRFGERVGMASIRDYWK